MFLRASPLPARLPAHPFVLQRVFEHLFARMSEGGGGNKFLVECSFLEIYNEVRRRRGALTAGLYFYGD